MNQERILSALIGLVGAVNNNGKTENTDSILANALLSADADDIVARIHAEKFTISPNCATCENPCGNTSDYNMKEFEDCPAEVLALKWRIWSMLRPIADRWQLQRSISNNKKEVPQLPDIIYKSISYLGYNLEQESYEILREELIL